jgi:hypothetical protein
MSVPIELVSKKSDRAPPVQEEPIQNEPPWQPPPVEQPAAPPQEQQRPFEMPMQAPPERTAGAAPREDQADEDLEEAYRLPKKRSHAFLWFVLLLLVAAVAFALTHRARVLHYWMEWRPRFRFR